MLGLPVTSDASSATSLSSDYILQTWTAKDGLPSGAVRALAETPDGFLWIGTGDELVRFDGSTFARIREISGTSLPTAPVYGLVSAQDGALWIGFGSPGGVARIVRNEATAFADDSGIRGTSVTALTQAANGSIWAGTRSGLFEYQSGSWRKFGPADGLPGGVVFSTYEDRSGALWVGTAEGVYRRSKNMSRFEEILSGPRFAPRFGEDGMGGVWITDASHGFSRLDRRIATPTGSVGTGYQLIGDPGGQIWVGTLDQGLWRVGRGTGDDVKVERLTSRDGLSSDAVTALFVARDGSLWVGTQNGLHRLTRRQLTASTIPGARSVASSADGHVWIGTAQGVVDVYGDRRTVYDTTNGLLGRVVTAEHVTKDGTLWVATESGVQRLVAGRFIALATSNVVLNRVYSIGSDSDGDVWACDVANGLFGWTTSSTLLPGADTAALANCSSVVSSSPHGDHVWVNLTDGRIARLGANRQYEFLEPPPNARRWDSYANYEDSSHVLWLAGRGLKNRIDGSVVDLDRSTHLQTSRIFSVVEDREGNAWVGSDIGILRISREELTAARHDERHHLVFRLFDVSDGAAGLPSAAVGNPAVTSDSRGNIWFITSTGVTVVDPHALIRSTAQFSTYVTALKADGTVVAMRPPLVLRPHVKTVQIDYGAIAFSSPNAVRFAYLLEGFDSNWVEAGTSRERILTNLSPRRYRFRVKALNKTGVWSDREGVLEFSVAPALYETTAFYLLCVVAVSALVAAGWQMHVRRLRREFALILTERARISREIHDTLLQGLIAVALRLDSLTDELGDPEAAKGALVRTRRRVEEYIRETRQSIFKLRSPSPDWANLASSIRLLGERAVADVHIDFSVDSVGSPRACPPHVAEQVVRVAEEAITNAVRHANATRISVTLEYLPKCITVIISDDGRGFDPEAVPDRTAGHYGLVTMRERIQQVHGTVRIGPRQGGGTIVELVVANAASDEAAPST
jgi:signal transduction histidine kinase/ligand-binding sensor domain-containing protein